MRNLSTLPLFHLWGRRWDLWEGLDSLQTQAQVAESGGRHLEKVVVGLVVFSWRSGQAGSAGQWSAPWARTCSSVHIAERGRNPGGRRLGSSLSSADLLLARVLDHQSLREYLCFSFAWTLGNMRVRRQPQPGGVGTRTLLPTAYLVFSALFAVAVFHLVTGPPAKATLFFFKLFF